MDEDYARNLRYGDQRRLEVARALATDPKLLLLDEPTAGMNPQESASFVEFVHKVRDERGISVLLIEHDMKVVMGVSERVTVLDHGEKIAEGTAEGGPARSTVIEAYLGTRGGERVVGVLLELTDVAHLLRHDPRAEGRLAARRRGRDRVADRLERGRQVHHAAHDQRASTSRAGARSSSTARTSRTAPRTTS